MKKIITFFFAMMIIGCGGGGGSSSPADVPSGDDGGDDSIGVESLAIDDAVEVMGEDVMKSVSGMMLEAFGINLADDAPANIAAPGKALDDLLTAACSSIVPLTMDSVMGDATCELTSSEHMDIQASPCFLETAYGNLVLEGCVLTSLAISVGESGYEAIFMLSYTDPYIFSVTVAEAWDASIAAKAETVAVGDALEFDEIVGTLDLEVLDGSVQITDATIKNATVYIGYDHRECRETDGIFACTLVGEGGDLDCAQICSDSGYSEECNSDLHRWAPSCEVCTEVAHEQSDILPCRCWVPFAPSVCDCKDAGHHTCDEIIEMSGMTCEESTEYTYACDGPISGCCMPAE